MSLSLHLNFTVSSSPGWNHSLNHCFQLSLPLTRSSTVTPITGRRPHHTQKTSYYKGDHFLLISRHNATRLFYFISPDAFHGSSFYTISRYTSIIVFTISVHTTLCALFHPFPFHTRSRRLRRSAHNTREEACNQGHHFLLSFPKKRAHLISL